MLGYLQHNALEIYQRLGDLCLAELSPHADSFLSTKYTFTFCGSTTRLARLIHYLLKSIFIRLIVDRISLGASIQ